MKKSMTNFRIISRNIIISCEDYANFGNPYPLYHKIFGVLFLESGHNLGEAVLLV